MSNYSYEDAAVRSGQKNEESRLLDLQVSKHSLIAGGEAGDLTVTDILLGDELVEVLHHIGAGTAITDIADLTSEFTVLDGKINNALGTSSAGGKLMVRWNHKTTV